MSDPQSEPSEFERFEEGLMEGWAIPLLAYGKQEELAEEFKVTTRTIRSWKKRIDWSKVRKEQQKRKDYNGSQVDDALTRKAIAGDVKAIELYKQTVEGWVPMSGQLKTDGTDAELIARAAEIKSKLDALAAGNHQPANGVGPDQPDAGKAATA